MSKLRLPLREEIDFDSNNKVLSLLKEYEARTFIEVGVYYGDTAKYLCEHYNFGRYYAVDSWLRSNSGLEGYTQEAVDEMYEICEKQLKEFDVEILKMDSAKASELFENNSIDCIFIDASHSFEGISDDIGAWFPKVRKLMIGHDYNLFKNVKKAVDFFLPQREVYNNLWYVRK